ncbi:MAG: methyltransferase domain-containing protein [Gemmatimonadota bacterium]|nr:methyltransferase domain-containing protein [Gemmatimonadota bacterium]MDH4350915.1 methyltransferase domain-containing protein [Gemmatimonadota bacterium]MDH5196324.1 methyltransferase domain-containing protein [Gemmatimonadota bacterium]
MTDRPDDQWLLGDAYEAYMGRWSRLVARAFVDWLRVAPSADWLEVGCGTGALTNAICDVGEPASVTACDQSASFITHARRHLPDPRATFVVTGADALPRRAGGYDAAVSGLVLNFLPDPVAGIRSLGERTRKGGTIAAYVWDYADGMEFLRVFWEEAAALDPGASALDEGTRFPLCRRPALESAWREAGLSEVEIRAVEIPTHFATFDDYWRPFLAGTGPAPTYVASLAPADRASLRERVRQRLPTGRNGDIRLRARAWAARGVAS